MLSISHGLTGAFLAAKLTNPVLFVPLTLASHYLEDWIPHWDVGTGLSTGKRKRHTAILLEFGDLFIMVVLIAAFAWFANIPWQHWWLLAAGAFIGLLPDFMEAPRNFLKWEPSFLKPFNNFHGRWHHSTPHMLFGLLPQFVVIALIFWLA